MTNLSKLLNYVEENKAFKIRSNWCPVCLHGFWHQDPFVLHKALCKRNVNPTTRFDMPKNQFIKFDQWEKTIEKKFVVYADFESILPHDEKYHQRHEPIAAGAVFLREGGVIEKFKNFGPNCV